MTICVESYLGGIGEEEGTKFEEHCLITKNGPVVLSKGCPIGESMIP